MNKEPINRRLEPEVSAMDLPKDKTASSAPLDVLMRRMSGFEDDRHGKELPLTNTQRHLQTLINLLHGLI